MSEPSVEEMVAAYDRGELYRNLIPALIASWRERGEALESFVAWSEAYPTDIFPEPDLKRAHELLQAGGMSLDAISANIMRETVGRIGDRARAALTETKGDE